jgi:hypothetical protein
MEAQKVNFPEVILAAAPRVQKFILRRARCQTIGTTHWLSCLAATDNFYPVEIMNYRLGGGSFALTQAIT